MLVRWRPGNSPTGPPSVLPTYCQAGGRIRTTLDVIGPTFCEVPAQRGCCERARTGYMRDGYIYGSEGCRFESCRAHQELQVRGMRALRGLAKRLEYCLSTAKRLNLENMPSAGLLNIASTDQKVAGSSPAELTSFLQVSYLMRADPRSLSGGSTANPPPRAPQHLGVNAARGRPHSASDMFSASSSNDSCARQPFVQDGHGGVLR